MSLVNVIVQEDAAYLITDSGSFSQDGTIAELLRKEIVIADVPVAISATGKIGTKVFPTVKRLLTELMKPEDFTLDELLRVVREIYGEYGFDGDAQPSTWFAAYYSRELGRAMGFKFFTNEGGGKQGVLPWTWVPTRLSLMPAVMPDKVFGKDAVERMRDGRRFKVPVRAKRLVEAQRRLRPESARGHCMVAGIIMLTEVSAAGVKQTVLHEYPDRVGEFAGG